MQNLFFSLDSIQEKNAAEKLCQLDAAKPYNPRTTKSAGKYFLCIEFPLYTGHDSLKLKPSLESLFLFGGLFAELLQKEMKK